MLQGRDVGRDGLSNERLEIVAWIVDRHVENEARLAVIRPLVYTYRFESCIACMWRTTRGRSYVRGLCDQRVCVCCE
jgi:hypothetical protein